jgi:hypothetical protein
VYPPETTDVDRRTVLKSVAASAGVAGLGSAAAAAESEGPTESERAALLDEYRDPETVRAVVDAQTELLDELAADGVIDEARIDGLDELSEPSGPTGEEIAVEQLGQEYTPRIRLFRSVDSGYLSVSVYPEQDTAHAVLNPVEDGTPLGEDHLVQYGSLPEAMGSCTGPGQCQECDCSEVCCRRDPDYGICLEWCTECICDCVCCECSIICPSFC